MKQIVRVSLPEFLKYSAMIAGIMLVVFFLNSGLSMDLPEDRSNYLIKYLFLGWGWVSMIVTTSYLPIFARQALTMGKTRREVLRALPALSAIAAISQMAACFFVGFVMRMVWGEQFQIEQVLGNLLVLFIAAGFSFALLGQLMGVLGMRFGAKGIWISMGTAIFLFLSLVFLFALVWSKQLLLMVVFFTTAPVWQIAAIAVGAVLVFGVLIQAASVALLRNFSVK